MSQIPEVRILPVKEYMKGEKQSVASRFIFTFLWRVGGCTLYQAVVLGRWSHFTSSECVSPV